MHKSTQARQVVLTEAIFIYKTGKFCNMVLDHQICDSSDGHVPELTKMHTNEPFICNLGVTLNAGYAVVVETNICPVFQGHIFCWVIQFVLKLYSVVQLGNKHLKLLLNFFFCPTVEISTMAVVGNNDSVPTVLSLLNVVVFVIADHKFSSFIILALKL